MLCLVKLNFNDFFLEEKVNEKVQFNKRYMAYLGKFEHGGAEKIVTVNIEGVMVLQSTEHGSLVWSLATNGEDLNFVFQTASPTTITKLKLVIFYQ